MSETTRSIREYSARMRRFVTVLWAVCLVLVVLERFSAATIRAFSAGFAGEPLNALVCQGISAFPEILFLVGLWWIRDALSAFARGELFAAPMTRMLERVGLLLACGAAVRILIVPGACRVVGFNAGYWIAFDAPAMMIGAIGLALRAIARVLRHAATMQSELDEIF